MNDSHLVNPPSKFPTPRIIDKLLFTDSKTAKRHYSL